MTSSAVALTDDLWRQSASELARRVSLGDVSATEVLTAHLARIAEVNPRLNAVVASLEAQARRDAAAIDARRLAGEPLGPLAGVPITVKDCFDVAGLETTLGLSGKNRPLATSDGPLIAALRQSGAVLVGKTNVPQLMLFHETDNPRFGRTNNPYHADRSPGGSSGGEAAIIAAGGVSLGLGTDLGGSIRQPAHACGIHGFKPTSHRLTTTGCATSLPGFEAIALQPGPLARRVDDLILTMPILASAGGDSSQPPVTWNDPGRVDLAGMRVAMFIDDGYFPVSPAIARATREAAAALEAAGAIVEPFAPPAVDEAMAIYYGLVGADGAECLRRLLDHGPTDSRIEILLRLGSLPGMLRRPVAWWLDRRGQHRRASLLRATGALSTAEFWRLTSRRDAYARRFFTALAAGGFQAMLCPPHGLSALRHGSAIPLIPAASYCLLPNLLGLPAGVVAATHVRQGEEMTARGAGDPSDRAATATEQGSVGLPVGVQVVAMPWRDDLVLAMMKRLEDHFGPPGIAMP